MRERVGAVRLIGAVAAMSLVLIPLPAGAAPPPSNLLDIWQQQPGSPIAPSDVASTNVFNGQTFPPPEAPWIELLPATVTTLRITGTPDELRELLDCGGVMTCSPEMTEAELTELLVFGIEHAILPEDRPPSYGVNLNVDVDPAIGGRFFSGTATPADCGAAANISGGQLYLTSTTVTDPLTGEFVEVPAPLAGALVPNGGLLVLGPGHPCAAGTGFQVSTYVLDSIETSVEHATPPTGQPMVAFEPTTIDVGQPVPTIATPTTTITATTTAAPTTTAAAAAPAATTPGVNSAPRAVEAPATSPVDPATNPDDGATFPWYLPAVGVLALGGAGWWTWRRRRRAGPAIVGDDGGPDDGGPAGESILDEIDDGIGAGIAMAGPILVASEQLVQARLEETANAAAATVAANFERLTQQAESFGDAYLDAVNGASAVEEQIERAGGRITLAEWADLAVMVIQLARLATAGIRGGVRFVVWLRSMPRAGSLADEAAAVARLPGLVDDVPETLVRPAWWNGSKTLYWEAVQLAERAGENLEDFTHLFTSSGRSFNDVVVALRRAAATRGGFVVASQAVQDLVYTLPFKCRAFGRGAAASVDDLRRLFQLAGDTAESQAKFLDDLAKAVDRDQLASATVAVENVRKVASPATLRRLTSMLRSPELRRLVTDPPGGPARFVEVALEAGDQLRVFVGNADEAVSTANAVLAGARTALQGGAGPAPSAVQTLRELLGTAGARGLSALVDVSSTTVVRAFTAADLELLQHALDANGDPVAIRDAAGPIPAAVISGSTSAVETSAGGRRDELPVLAPYSLSPQWFADQRAMLDTLVATSTESKLGSLEHRIDELLISDDLAAHDFWLWGLEAEAGGTAARFGWAFSHLVEAPITTMTRWAHEDDLVDAFNAFVGDHRSDFERMVHGVDAMVDTLRGLAPELRDLHERLTTDRSALGDILDQLRARTPDDRARIDHIATKLGHIDAMAAGLKALGARVAMLADWLDTLVTTPDGRRRDATTLLDPTSILRVGRTLLEVGNLSAQVLGLDPGAAASPSAPADPALAAAMDEATRRGDEDDVETMTDEEYRAAVERTKSRHEAEAAAERAAHDEWVREHVEPVGGDGE